MNNKGRLRWIFSAVLIVECLFLFLPWFVQDQRALLRDDSGIFLYAGKQVALGATLYVDVWDHKPPLIFWLNALGALWTPDSPLGVFLICLVSTSAAVLVLYLGACNLFCPVAGFLAASTLILGLSSQLDQPNFTEVFALPWQALLGYIGLRSMQGSSNRVLAILGGISIPILIATRPNHVGAALFFFVGILLSRDSSIQRFKSFLCSACAGLVSAGFLLLPFWIQGTLTEMTFASVKFNLIYSSQLSMGSRLAAAVSGVLQLFRSGVLPIAASLSALLLYPTSNIGVALILWLVAEIGLASMGGRSFPHYFVICLMAASWIVAAGASQLMGSPMARRYILTLSTSIFLYLGLAGGWAARSTQKERPLREDPILQEMRQQLAPGKSYYYWGLAPRHLWYMLDRPIHPALFHTTPLLAFEGQYRVLAPGLLAALLSAPPDLIVEDLGAEASLDSGPWDSRETSNQKKKLMQLYSLERTKENRRYWRKLTAEGLNLGR